MYFDRYDYILESWDARLQLPLQHSHLLHLQLNFIFWCAVVGNLIGFARV